MSIDKDFLKLKTPSYFAGIHYTKKVFDDFEDEIRFFYNSVNYDGNDIFNIEVYTTRINPYNPNNFIFDAANTLSHTKEHPIPFEDFFNKTKENNNDLCITASFDKEDKDRFSIAYIPVDLRKSYAEIMNGELYIAMASSGQTNMTKEYKERLDKFLDWLMDNYAIKKVKG